MFVAGWNAYQEVRWPWRRLLPALIASAVAHYLIVDVWQPAGGLPQFPATLPPLQAQLEIPRVAMTEPETAVTERFLPEPAVRSGPEPRPVRLPQAMPPVAAAVEMQSPGNSGAAVPDPRIYPARELDRFPFPLMPLDLRTGQGRTGTARFWVSIDITGSVVEAEFIAADLPAALVSSARELLLAARFSPGFRDERPVKSRILLELRYGP